MHAGLLYRTPESEISHNKSAGMNFFMPTQLYVLATVTNFLVHQDHTASKIMGRKGGLL